MAQPEAAPEAGTPIRWVAQSQHYDRERDEWTLSGDVTVYYRDYVLRASKVIFNRQTSQLQAEGPLHVDGGPDDIHLDADHGEMNLEQHTARYYAVSGSSGLRNNGRTTVYSTVNPFRFKGRLLMQLGEGSYRIVDGSMTNCRLPHPDWQLLSRSIDLQNRVASTSGSTFKFLGVPLLYLPYLRHPIDDTGRQSGLLIPVLSNSTTKGFTLGEQVYVVLNRSMDMVVGSEYFSKRGWAPNGDFRYKGLGDDHLQVRWNAVLDRGVEEAVTNPNSNLTSVQLVNQGGADLVAQGRKDLSASTHLGVFAEYLSSFTYRLVFTDNFALAVTSEVSSTVGLTHAKDGLVPSVMAQRFENFANSSTGSEARILHLPSLRYDVLDRPLLDSPFYFGGSATAGFLNRSEPHFHARNLGRFDLYPHLSLPLHADGWSLVPEVATRETFYTASETPDLTGVNHWAPTIRQQTLNRSDVEASVALLPPSLMRDFTAAHWNRILRHVVTPELTYHYVHGIGAQPQNIVRVDTADIATDTNEVGVSFLQQLYMKPLHPQPCPGLDGSVAVENCPAQPREWASWEIAQKYYLDSTFGGALISGQRNVFDSTLALTGVSFLNGSRNLSPVTSRMRFEGIDNLRIEWDLDYDPKAGIMTSDNVYAGYSVGRTTVGIGHALLNAVNEHRGGSTTIKSQILQPFLSIGKPTQDGFNLALNAGYDFVLDEVQYGGVQANYNWNCCGLSFGYRRFQLGTLRDETQYLYSFTIANFGSVGDIRRSNTVFRDPSLAPAY